VNLALSIPPEVVDAIVADVLERVRHEAGDDGYLDVPGAAEFLACPKSRIYSLVSQKAIPFEKDGSRTLFEKDALRAWVRNGGAKRS
jgi:excisionase family DNA binding protein